MAPTEADNAALIKTRQNGRETVDFVPCATHKIGDPVFNVSGNITGMTHKGSPVSNMKMKYHSRPNAAPQVDFDIDLNKEAGEDERFRLSNEPSPLEAEKRVQAKLCRLEGDLEQLWDHLAYVKILTKEWNAQKAGLCNRRWKDYPKCCKNNSEDN